MISRRTLLGAGLAASLVPLAGCVTSGGAAPQPRTPTSLTEFDVLGGAALSYEETGNAQSFRADPAFVELLQQWAEEWTASSGLGPITAVSTYGAYVDKYPSWHASGRAFDIASITHRDATVSCRYDQWGEDQQRLNLYWRLAASLSTRFTYTLTYPYNAQHHNHIHIDNGVNGYDTTSYRERSRAQTYVLQGVLRHVHGKQVEFNGQFDDMTRLAASEVQVEAGIGDRLSSSQGWRAFLDYSVARRG